MAMKLVTKFLVRHNFQTCAELFWSPVNLEMRHDECFTADYSDDKSCCCNIAAGQKCFSNPGRKLRKEKQQEFVFHLLFFHIIVETGDIQISLKGASHRAMTQTKFHIICNVRSFSDEII